MTRRISIAVVAALGFAWAASAGLRAAASTRVPPPGSLTSRVFTLHDSRGIHPGLEFGDAAAFGVSRALIASLHTSEAGSLSGYERVRRFGSAWTDNNTATWGHDGCDTRNEILQRDLTKVTFRPGTHRCVVLSGRLLEPYSKRNIVFSKARPLAVQINHVVPLAYAWMHGAGTWTQAKRVRLANDPLNLLAVDGPTNESKGDRGPAEFRPSYQGIRCAYAVRFAQVARRYAIPVTASDKGAMVELCAEYTQPS